MEPRRHYRRKYTFKDHDFPLEVRAPYTQPQADWPVHTHDFSELVFILGGRAVHITEDGRYPVAMGDVFVTLPGQAHGYAEAVRLERQIVMYDHDALLRPPGDLPRLPGYHALFVLEPRYRRQHGLSARLHLDADDLALVRQRLAAMQEEMDARAPGYQAMAAALLRELVVFLSRCYSRVDNPSAQGVLRLGEVLSYLETHYAEPLRTADLARRAHLSPTHFARLFRKATGHPPIDYLIRLRVAKAAEHLRSGGANVTEAALAAGFNDSNYFARQFRRVMGTTPRAYRRSARTTGGGG